MPARLECSSVVEHLLSVCQALGPVPSTEKKEKKRKKEEEEDEKERLSPARA